jgi:hypothetical protein
MFKVFAGIVAVVLMLSYLLPVVIKLKEVSLGVVILIALTMMLVDLRQSLKSRED